MRGEESEFSVRDYATRLLRSDISAEARAVLLALLNCGTAVQSFLSYRLGSLPNAYLTEEERVILPPLLDDDLRASYLPAPPENAQANATLSGVTLVQNGSLTFRFYVSFLDGVAPDGYVLEVGSVKEGGAPDFSAAERVQIEQKEDGRFVAASPLLSLLSLRDELSLRILSPDGKESDTYFYSVALFVKDTLASEISSEEREVLLSTLALSDALVAYEKSLS